MITRKQFIHRTPASTAAAVGARFFLQACFSNGGDGDYDTTVRNIWHPAIWCRRRWPMD